MEAKLAVIQGEATKKEITVRSPTTIGRGHDTGLTIGHPLVSRIHAILDEVGGALVIRDANSANGTFVNDQRISQAVLAPGDRLTVGPLTFVVLYRGPDDLSSVRKAMAITGQEGSPQHLQVATPAPKGQSWGKDSALQANEEPTLAELEKLDPNDVDSGQLNQNRWHVTTNQAAEDTDVPSDGATPVSEAATISTFFQDLIEVDSDEVVIDPDSWDSEFGHQSPS